MRNTSVHLETYHALVEAIYEAALEPDLWKAFLEKLTKSLGGHAALFRLYDPNTMALNYAVAYGHDWDYIRDYHDYYAPLDPTLPGFEKVAAGEVIDRAQYISDKSWSHTEAYNDFCRLRDVFHFMGSYAVKEQDKVLRLGVHRSKKAGAFTETDRHLVNLLNPHLMRAFKIIGKFSTLKTHSNTSGDALDHLKIGVILLDQDGRPVYSNRQAEKIIKGNNGLTMCHNVLRASRAKDTRNIHQLIANATRGGEKPRQGGAIRLVRPAKLPLSVMVSPLNQEQNGSLADFFSKIKAGAIVFISETENEQDFSVEALQKLYSFTKTEAFLVKELTCRASTTQIAERMKISPHTLRSHLKSIFRKASVNSQVELVSLVLSSPAGMVMCDNVDRPA